MVRWLGVLLLLAIPGAEACGDQAGSANLDLMFPKPEGCKRDAPKACPPLPEADVPFVIDGTLLWSWELDTACSTVTPSATPVHIHLDGLERLNAGWLELTAEPSEITISPDQQWDPTDDAIDPVAGRIISQESFPVRVTVTLVGEPSPEALDRLAARDGVAAVDLKAVAAATESFLPVTNLEAFLFDGRAAMEPDEDGSSRGIPAPSALLALAVAAMAAALRRR